MGKNTIRKLDDAKAKMEKGIRRVRMSFASTAQLAEAEYIRCVSAEQALAEIERILGKDDKTEGTLPNRLAERLRKLEAQGEQLRAVIGKTKDETHAQWHQAFRDSRIAITRKGPVEVMELLKSRETNVLCISKEVCAKTAEEAACPECRTSVGEAVRGSTISSAEKEAAQ